MLYSHNSFRFLSIVAVLAVSLTLLGCDSGGSNGGGGGGGFADEVKLKVEGSAETSSLNYLATFHYDLSGNNCPAAYSKEKDFEDSFTVTLDPTNIDNNTCADDPQSYKGAEAQIADIDGRDLTLKLLDGNDEVLGETSEPNGNGQYVVKAGDTGSDSN